MIGYFLFGVGEPPVRIPRKIIPRDLNDIGEYERLDELSDFEFWPWSSGSYRLRTLLSAKSAQASIGHNVFYLLDTFQTPASIASMKQICTVRYPIDETLVDIPRKGL